MAITPRLFRSTSSALALAVVLAPAQTHADDRDPGTPPPQVELGFGFRGVTSANGFITAPTAPTLMNPAGAASQLSGVLDFSDTSLYIQPRLQLYRQSLRIGGMFALTFPDVYFEPGTIFLGEGHLFLESRWATVKIGRTRVLSSIVSFPTLRDDDLIRFTDAQNPYSDGRSTADHQYGNTVEATAWLKTRWFVDMHAENMPNFVLRPESLGAFALNSFGGDLGYQQIPALARISVVRRAGVGVNVYNVDEPQRKLTFEALGGLWMNLIVDPIHNLEWRVQAIYNYGVPRATLATLNDTFRAEQMSITSALQYDYRRQLLPTFRAAMTGAYKRYLGPGIDQWAVVANAFYSLGLGVDLGLQYEYRSRSVVPEAFGDNQEHALKLALIARFDIVFNRQFDSRDSLLNTQSGYLP